MTLPSRLRLITGLITLTTAGMLTAYWVNLESAHGKLRADALAQTELQASKLAEATVLATDDLIRGVDLTLRHLGDDYFEDRSSFERGVQATRSIYPADAIVNISVINAAGYAEYNTVASARSRVYIGDRDYFRRHATGAGDELLISRPLQGRVSKVWVILFTRKIMHHGRFAGVMVLSLRAEYVSRMLARIVHRPEDAISLFDQGGAYLARNRDMQGALGKTMPPDRPFLGPNAAASGVFRTIAAHDHVHRIYGWRRLDHAPLVVAVGLATDPVLASLEAQIVQNRRANIAGSVLILAALMLIVGLLAQTERQQRRIHDDDESLRVAKTAFDAAAEGILVTDADNRIVLANPAFTRITGYAADEVIGKTPAVFSSGLHDREFYERMWQIIDETGGWEGEVTNRHKDGRLYVEWLKIATIAKDNPRERRHVAVISDITLKKQEEERVWRHANFDELTGLPTRRLALDRLHQAIGLAERNRHHAAVMFIDLDDFKPVNDRYGHQAGDELLKQVASRMVFTLRDEDTVARLGGDEFVVLLPSVRSADDAVMVAEKLLAAVSTPFDIDGASVRISASIGVALYPEDGQTPEALIDNADVAMYRAKQAGRHAVRRHSTDASPPTGTQRVH